jgi:hypothetical protein
MKFLALIICMMLSSNIYAQHMPDSYLDTFTEPLRAQSVFNGTMLPIETEYLTPEGIIDDLPALHAQTPTFDFHDIEPAAGPVPDHDMEIQPHEVLLED